MARGEKVEFADVLAEHETDKALLCRFPDREAPVWIPKGQIDNDSEVYKKGHKGKLVVSEWIATEKGLV